ncbi:MAG: acetylneuraminic acid synthetase, partial [Desulfobulbaceae bacterium]
MEKAINIDNAIIGPGKPTYIIAEVGINHNGDEETAYQLIDAAIEAQVDAVKFQKRYLPALYPEDIINNPEKYEQTFQYMIPLLKKVELSNDTFIRIKDYCDKKEITFICTPFDEISADFIHDLGTVAFKVASADLTNDDLLTHLAAFEKPLIMSTGMSTWDEIDHTASLMESLDAAYAFLHCRSVYPVWPREVNLGMINKLRKYGVPVGYSGHEIGITVALVAASMGAEIIEKHITLDRKQEGPDHKASLEPYEFKRLVRDIRVADQALGRDHRYLLRGEVLNRELFAKSLVAKETIERGTVVQEGMIKVQGPAKGLPPYKRKDLIGRKTIRTIEKDECFVDEDLGQSGNKNFNNAFKGDWGLIARFTDYQDMLKYEPKVIEFHLAENDFDIPFEPSGNLDC